MRWLVTGFAVPGFLVVPAYGQQASRDRADWIALAKSGFALADGRSALDVLLEMDALLGSPDPILRDEVAFSAAERWILRERRLTPDQLRRLLQIWTKNLDEGLGGTGDDRVFKRSFSALSLSLIAARDLTAPFLDGPEVQAFFDRTLDYFERERDLRGFDATRGWMHTVAHTADVLKYLARNPKLASGSHVRLLAAVRVKIESSDAVFVWGDNDRVALALHAVVRRNDADSAALASWIEHWMSEYQTLWAGGPHVDARRFARVENARQVLRSLFVALSNDSQPTPNGDAAREAVLAALAKMR